MENTNRKFYPRRPVNITNLTKSFESFEDGYKEVLKFVPEVKEYCGENSDHNTVVTNILNVIKDNIPSVDNPNYPHTMSLSIDSHEVGFRTDGGLAFGWRTIFDRESGKNIYKFRITFLILPVYRKNIMTDMQEAGWTLIDTNARQSRFWKSTTNTQRRNNKFTNRMEIPQEVKDAVAPKVEEVGTVDVTVRATEPDLGSSDQVEYKEEEQTEAQEQPAE